MTTVNIPLGQVTDWNSFHDIFAKELEFIPEYGQNMNAFLDCLSDWSRPGIVGMMGIEVPFGEDLVLQLKDASDFSSRLPEIADAMWNAVSAINKTRIGFSESGRLLLCIV